MLPCVLEYFVQEDETISPRRQKDLHAFSDTLTIFAFKLIFSACRGFLLQNDNDKLLAT